MSANFANFERLLKISNTLQKLQMEIQESLRLEIEIARGNDLLLLENYEYELSDEELSSLIENSPGDLETQTTEDLERELNNYLHSLERMSTPEYRQEIDQKIEALFQEIVDIVNRYRQGVIGKIQGERNYKMVKEFLDEHEHWQEDTKITYIDDCMVNDLGLSLSTVQKCK